MKFSTATSLLISSLASSAFHGADAHDDLCEADCTSGTCTFTFKVNTYAGELGYYEVAECPTLGTNPTLAIEKNKNYLFDQGDISNYMHPLGLAYYTDGAHTGVDELEPGIAPYGTENTCADNDANACPAPMYNNNGAYLGDYSNNADVAPVTEGLEDFGLDHYEPLFFYPLGDWVENAFSVNLIFDDADFMNDIFYFCHIHAGMTGRIKFVDATGAVLQEADEPAIDYEYDVPSAFDEECGTYGIEPFQLPNSQCPESFVCNAPDLSYDLGKYASCYDAMDCAMMVGMTTYVEDAKSLFIHQMIPHHQNAVNMAKALLKSGGLECDDVSEETSDCALKVIAMSIIAHQNHQIQGMQAVLDEEGYLPTNDCEVTVSSKGGKAGKKGSKGTKGAKGSKGSKVMTVMPSDETTMSAYP